nr:CRISPR-associated protein Csx15 [Ardenticatena sp.]
MILLNFAHPITEEQKTQIEALTNQPIERIIVVNSQIDTEQPLAPQIAAMADAAGLTPEEWQTLPLLINPPALNYSAVALLAELHGRMGYFPPVLRLKPVLGPDDQRLVPPRFAVAEILNLQAIRDEARARR